jgi:alginate O-acetyltransferase complex protein AlgI
MLFNSYEFVSVFLPVAFVGFFLIAGVSHRLAALWLGLASLVFYGYWNPQFVLLLLGSIAFNYAMGRAISHRQQTSQGKAWLAAAITANLVLLGIFKYANFFITNVNTVTDAEFSLFDIVLPLGISFFTFTQITFLVDTYRGIAREYSFIHYLLFVTYFPHLIAGPVLHHKQMMPQFADSATYRICGDAVVLGISIFVIGLAKKVLLADSFSEYATAVFSAADRGEELQFFEAWVGALAYTLQLYFDFSGYSDMAIGLSKMFGVDLPVNFNSPYKATNIIDFWRRWHMTLSQFLRDYLYIPLGGNRRGPVWRHFNLMVTMLIGGLWHGANWTFVVWGALHGVYLMINHGWRAFTDGKRWAHCGPTRLTAALGVAITFLGVVAAWVIFRADSLGSALSILEAMSLGNGLSLPAGLVAAFGQAPLTIAGDGFFPVTRLSGTNFLPLLAIGLGIVFLCPNSQQLVLGAHDAGMNWRRFLLGPAETPGAVAGVLVGALLACSLWSFSKGSEFLYYQF